MKPRVAVFCLCFAAGIVADVKLLEHPRMIASQCLLFLAGSIAGRKDCE